MPQVDIPIYIKTANDYFQVLRIFINGPDLYVAFPKLQTPTGYYGETTMPAHKRPPFSTTVVGKLCSTTDFKFSYHVSGEVHYSAKGNPKFATKNVIPLPQLNGQLFSYIVSNGTDIFSKTKLKKEKLRANCIFESVAKQIKIIGFWNNMNEPIGTKANLIHQFKLDIPSYLPNISKRLLIQVVDASNSFKTENNLSSATFLSGWDQRLVFSHYLNASMHVVMLGNGVSPSTLQSVGNTNHF